MGNWSFRTTHSTLVNFFFRRMRIGLICSQFPFFMLLPSSTCWYCSTIRCPVKHFFLFGSHRNKLKHQAVSNCVLVCLWNYNNFVFDLERKLSGKETNRNEPKWRSTRQNRQIPANNACLASKVFSFGSTINKNSETSCFDISWYNWNWRFG